jgi:hypothetical protein
VAGFVGDVFEGLRQLGLGLSGMGEPTLRLGVTGLSRSGKTVFITALIHALIGGGRLPVFRSAADGRIRGAVLAAQPDDTVPRFPYEDHLAALTAPDRRWPDSTRRISEVRLVITYESAASWSRGPWTLTLDIVDYPGEWLLDLPLLETSYSDWAQATIALAEVPPRRALAEGFLRQVRNVDAGASADETAAHALAQSFTGFLRACRDERVSLSSLPPGRFLMPGDLDGSPALTFAPLPRPDATPASGSLYAMMERRYESYKAHVVRPFFRDHFSRLDRQIVLVDALSALNAGPAAVADLEAALSDVLKAFRTGRNSLFSSWFAPRIDRVLFAATKADHLHHTNHDRLESLVRTLVDRAAIRAEAAGASIDVVALAAVRATREVQARDGFNVVNCIAGVPLAGENLDGEIFDGIEETALFPGDLPATLNEAMDGRFEAGALRFLRFRPPVVTRTPDGRLAPLPHIRLDRTLEFLMGDRLR